MAVPARNKTSSEHALYGMCFQKDNSRGIFLLAVWIRNTVGSGSFVVSGNGTVQQQFKVAIKNSCSFFTHSQI